MNIVYKKLLWKSKYISLIIIGTRANRKPATWKLSKIVPVPKSNNVKDHHDLRPIVLTSTLVKILERIVMNNFLLYVSNFNPLQLAYRKNRGRRRIRYFIFYT